jgi:hypothetical protein
MTKKKIAAYLENAEDLEAFMTPEIYRNYKRNQLLVDLEYTPDAVKENIINTYESAKVSPRMKILNYFIKNRCRMLIECIEDF